MEKKRNHELFYRHRDNPILSVDDWPYDANSVFNAAEVTSNKERNEK